MARTTPASRAGRTLVIFFMTIGVIYGLVAIAGSWKPELGLDLQGGTRITLIAKDQNNSSANLEEARKIIDRRVNGSGVTEAEVTTQGNRFIVVEIPGESRADLVDTVKRQAQLRFRVVAQTADGTAPASTGSAEPSGLPSQPLVTAPASPTKKPKPSSTASATPKNRAPFVADQSSPSPSLEPTSLPGGVRERIADRRRHGDADRHPERLRRGRLGHRRPADVDAQPRPEVAGGVQRLPVPGARARPPTSTTTRPSRWSPVTRTAVKYLLSAALIEGTQLSAASLLSPNGQQLEYGVNLEFNGEGADEFGRISDALYGTDRQFAIVLDGEVISAPVMNAPIHDGKAQITGSFTAGRGRQPGHQPEVRRAADPVPVRPAGRDRRPVARRQPALGRDHRRSRRPRDGDALLPALLPRPGAGRASPRCSSRPR